MQTITHGTLELYVGMERRAARWWWRLKERQRRTETEREGERENEKDEGNRGRRKLTKKGLYSTRKEGSART